MGSKVGTLVGFGVGIVGARVVGRLVGATEGFLVGVEVGCLDGLTVGCLVTFLVGVAVGRLEGLVVGSLVAFLVGVEVGSLVGLVVGSNVGDSVVGSEVGGVNVGNLDGASVVGVAVVGAEVMGRLASNVHKNCCATRVEVKSVYMVDSGITYTNDDLGCRYCALLGTVSNTSTMPSCRIAAAVCCVGSWIALLVCPFAFVGKPFNMNTTTRTPYCAGWANISVRT